MGNYKTICLVAILFVFATSVFAQNGKKGQNYEVVISGNFEVMRDFSDGLAFVTLHYKEDPSFLEFGYIDKKGEFFLHALCEAYGAFSEGLAWVWDFKNWKYGYIDKTDNWVIPAQYDYAEDFHEGLAIVKSDNKYIYIDKTGESIFSTNYEEAFRFSEGLAVVCINDKYGYIDKTGKLVIPATYDRASRFSNGLAIVVEDGIYKYIDHKAKTVLTTNTLEVTVDNSHECEEALFSEGLAAFYDESVDKWGYIDKKGKTIIPATYNEAGHFSEGLACVKINEKYGFINKKGKIVVDAVFNWASSVSEGLAAVSLEDDSSAYIKIKLK